MHGILRPFPNLVKAAVIPQMQQQYVVVALRVSLSQSPHNMGIMPMLSD